VNLCDLVHNNCYPVSSKMQLGTADFSVHMQNINDNIDLDALFDMLNIGSGPATKASDAPEKAFISHLDPTTHEVPDLSPLGTDYIIDLPVDQS